MFESTDSQAFVLECVLFFTDYNLHTDIKRLRPLYMRVIKK